jgi:hypothetical protein
MNDGKKLQYSYFRANLRESFNFVQKLANFESIEWPEFNSCSLPQFQKRAASLVVVAELDALASFICGHKNNKRAFIDILKKWTDNKVFSAIWPRKLIECIEETTGHSYREVWNKAQGKVKELELKTVQGRDEYNIAKKEIIDSLRSNSVLNDQECETLRGILWKISDEDQINPELLKAFEKDLKDKKKKWEKCYQYHECAKLFLQQIEKDELLPINIIKQKLEAFLKTQNYDQHILGGAKKFIMSNVDKSSYAACVYEFRCQCVHRFDGVKIDFDNKVTYEGKPVETIDLNLLIESYDKILSNIEEMPIEEFGKLGDRYMKF